MEIRQDIALRYLFAMICAACCLIERARAQTTTAIIAELKATNSKVTNTPCTTGKGMLISNKAMNIFLSNKVSSYLSDQTDLSLYKNYVTLNAAEGSIAINHDFHQPVDSDDWVRSFNVVGARVNVANAYASRFSNKYYDNRLGFELKHTWMGKPVTYYNQCGSEKMAMDAQRASIVHSLEIQLKQEAADFERSLDSLRPAEVPGQDINAAKEKLRHDFYANLRAEHLQNFSQAQSTYLVNSFNFELVTDNWTTAGIYIPIINQKFEVSQDVTSPVVKQSNYPFELFVTHTRFWESSHFGRLFFTVNAKAFVNNSVQAGLLYQASVTGSSGISGSNTTAINNGSIFVGDYKNFVTPVASAKLVYIPFDSHVGVSARIEKNFGTYHAVNAILAIPIVLIDKNTVPAITFEPQILLSDITGSVKNTQLPYNKTAIGLTVGIPFSKIVY